MDLEQLEALALGDDRSAALATLLPGTVEHDYWRGVQLQHQGELAAVDELLAGWQRRHGSHDEHHQRLFRRQLLLRAAQDLGAHADTLRFEAGLALDDSSKDAAIVITLDPGAYSAQVSSANGSAGLVLIEVYDVP